MTTKYVLITGASSGLGKETAIKLANDGYIVFAGVRKENDANTLNKMHTNIRALILDVTSDTQTLGKPVGSDIDNDKCTYVSLLGLEESRALVSKLTQEAIDALDAFNGDTSSLKKLAIDMANRKN